MARMFIALSAVFLTVITVLTLFDLSLETEPNSWPEIAVDITEKVLWAASMVAIAWVTVTARDLRQGQEALRNNLTRAIARGEDWRQRSRAHLQALTSAIDAQFSDWELTPAEADIAGLMLKGASLREIAELRETSEATIRQQAQSVYRKSGLAGRAELSAYFLQSLFETSEDNAAGLSGPPSATGRVHRL